jgi:hypothetical protein
MSKYTTELRYIVNSGYDLGLDDYPLFSDEYRERLNEKIINHFLFHEIGFETVEKFKNRLNVKMNEIMPYYNQLYESELKDINPLLTFERVKTENMDKSTKEQSNNSATIDNESVNSTTSSEDMTNESTQSTDLDTTRQNSSDMKTDEKIVDSETPTSQVLMSDIDDNFYASKVSVRDNEEISNETENVATDEEVTKTDSSQKTNSSETLNESNTVSSTETDKDVDEEMTTMITENGFEVPLSDLIIKYRKTFLNIDMMIIKELDELFMMVY